MRKIFKAAAALTVGGALLSTSAFAALSGTAVYNASTGKIDVNVSGLGTGESTIMVLKSATAINAIPSTVADADIVYIDQKTAVEGKASYSVDPGTRGADVNTYYVFAGGTNESSAKFLGAATRTIAATGVVIKEGGADAVAAKDVAIGAVLTFAAVVSPDNATDTVNWTVSPSAEGILTVAADGTATFTAPTVDTDTVYTVTATAGTASDSIALTVKAPAAPGRDFITAADTTKATITSHANSTTAGAAWSFTGYREELSVKLDAEKYPNAADAKAGYTVKVVDNEGNDVAGAAVFYSTERGKYVVLIPEGVTEYKYEVVSGGNTNTVINRYGDVLVNAQNAINLSDSALVTRAAKGLMNLTDLQKVTADVVMDGKVNLSDSAAITRYAKGLMASFPVVTK